MRTFQKKEDGTIRVTLTEETEYPVEKIQIIRTNIKNNINAFKEEIAVANKNIKAMKASIKTGEYLKQIKNSINSIKLHIKHMNDKLKKEELDLIELEAGMRDLNVPINEADKKAANPGKAG